MKMLLDTHVWVWWIDGTDRLSVREKAAVDAAAISGGVGVCAISCWEVAMNVDKGRIKLSIPVDEWVTRALAYQGVIFAPLTPAIAVASVSLPGDFHGDPADRLIVATARALDLPLATHDGPISRYPHVRLAF